MTAHAIMFVDDTQRCQNNSMNSKRNYSNSPLGEIKQGTIPKSHRGQFTSMNSKLFSETEKRNYSKVPSGTIHQHEFKIISETQKRNYSKPPKGGIHQHEFKIIAENKNGTIQMIPRDQFMSMNSPSSLKTELV